MWELWTRVVDPLLTEDFTWSYSRAVGSGSQMKAWLFDAITVSTEQLFFYVQIHWH